MVKSFDIQPAPRPSGKKPVRREKPAKVVLATDPELTAPAIKPVAKPAKKVEPRVIEVPPPMADPENFTSSFAPAMHKGQRRIAWLNIALFVGVLLFASVAGGQLYRQSKNKSVVGTISQSPVPTLSSTLGNIGVTSPSPSVNPSVSSSPSPSPSPSESPSAAPTPPAASPTPDAPAALSKSQVSVQVLNGNGQTGQASTVAANLKKDGYVNVKVGNARSFTFASTIIYYQSGRLDEAKALKTAYGKAAKLEESSISSTLQLVLGKS